MTETNQTNVEAELPQTQGTSFQYRSSLKVVVEMIALLSLTKEQKTKLKKYCPFWNLINEILVGRITSIEARKSDKDVMELIGSYSLATNSFNIGGKQLVVRPSDFVTVFGVSGGEKTIKLGNSKTEDSSFYKKNFSNITGPLNHKKLSTVLLNSAKNSDRAEIKIFVKLLSYYIIAVLFAPTKGTTVTWGYIDFLRKVEEISSYDWSSHFHEKFEKSVKYHFTRPENVTGCVMVLPYLVLESFSLVSTQDTNAKLICSKWKLRDLCGLTRSTGLTVVIDSQVGTPGVANETVHVCGKTEVDLNADGGFDETRSQAVESSRKSGLKRGRNEDFVDEVEDGKQAKMRVVELELELNKKSTTLAELWGQLIEKEREEKDRLTRNDKVSIEWHEKCLLEKEIEISSLQKQLRARDEELEELHKKYHELEKTKIDLEGMEQDSDNHHSKTPCTAGSSHGFDTSAVPFDILSLEHVVVSTQFIEEVTKVTQDPKCWMKDNCKEFAGTEDEVNVSKPNLSKSNIRSMFDLGLSQPMADIGTSDKKSDQVTEKTPPIRTKVVLSPSSMARRIKERADRKMVEQRGSYEYGEKKKIMCPAPLSSYPVSITDEVVRKKQLPKKWPGVSWLDPKDKKMLDNMYSTMRSDEVLWLSKEAHVHIELKDVLNILQRKPVSSNVINAHSAFLKSARPESGLFWIFEANVWSLIRKLDSSSQNLGNTKRKEVVNNVVAHLLKTQNRYWLFPLNSNGNKGLAKQPFHWTLLVFDMVTTKWCLYNSIKARDTSRDDYLEDARRVMVYVERCMKECGVACKNSTLVNVEDFPRQEDDSIECGYFCCYAMEAIVFGRTIPKFFEKETISCFGATMVGRILMNCSTRA